MSEQNKNFIIFGGCGFIGNHLIKYLNNISEKPLVCDLHDRIFIDDMKFIFEKIDVRNQINTVCIPSKEGIIYNLAAIHKTPGHKSKEYYNTNINGAINICNYARENSIKTIKYKRYSRIQRTINRFSS